LDEARASADAVGGYQVVYEVLGLDKGFVEGVIARRKKTM